MEPTLPYRLFEAIGVELEYMIVDRHTLDVRPLSDQVLTAQAGRLTEEVEVGTLSWSNELVLHVIELKTSGPARSLDGLVDAFQRDVGRIDTLLEPHQARLMPTAVHPWMDPMGEMRLWPHNYNAVYAALDRIFDCRGHGWANLQSAHLNLPFHGDEEFARLHTAIRLVLPLLPAIAASSPVLERRETGFADSRLEAYRTNAARIPSVTGLVVPELVRSEVEYRERILAPIYADVAPHDPDGVLRHEWMNARGAIARFDRSTIEIRVLDVQECPRADLAIARWVVEVLKGLCEERWSDVAEQQSWPTERLSEILAGCTRYAERAALDAKYCGLFGAPDAMTAGELCRHLFEANFSPDERSSADLAPLRTILDRGTLATRITAALSGHSLDAVYRRLCDCLRDGVIFAG